MDLFEHNLHNGGRQGEEPLAARMRPRTLDEFIGQEHILAPGRLLRRAIQADQLSSLLFYGPPGTGKTTLAAVIANTTQSHFETLNAVLAGVPDIRRVTEEAKRRIAEYQRRTILFVDEVHRWNKAQQDALLPWVENGSVILIGATTENPYFTVNRALVSRSRIFQLRPLSEENLQKVAQMALSDQERGYGNLKVECSPEALQHIVNVANGDARAVLNGLELAVETTEPEADSTVRITMDVAEESIQKRAVLYDKEGDYHFDTISAFIKSLRGSDPDAAMYWLAKMVYAGEDPRFIFRRMLIFAAEDIGLAQPYALGVVESAAAAFDRVGLPEGQYHLGMTALYLATAPKSNSVFAYFDALATIEKQRDGEVPTHLKDASRDKQSFGHGQGYTYPHAYREHWVAQQYLPAALRGNVFYRPSEIGYEKEIGDTVERRREAQLAAALETEEEPAMAEIFSWSPPDKQVDAWLRRASGKAGERRGRVRDRLFELAQCRRHHRLLCVGDDTGLLTWEAIRQTPEGGVCTHAKDKKATEHLRERARQTPALRAPRIINCPLTVIPEKMENDWRFERIIGHNIVFNLADKRAVLKILYNLLTEMDGRLVLAEAICRRAPRLADMPMFQNSDQSLIKSLREAEEAIYQNPDDPMVNWDEATIRGQMEESGFSSIDTEVLTFEEERIFPPGQVDYWFAKQSERKDNKSGLGDILRRHLGTIQAKRLQDLLKNELTRKQVPWKTCVLVVKGDKVKSA